MSEYIVLEKREQKQEEWTETRDEKNRLLRPARPARDEEEVFVRVDRQYSAKVRIPSGVAGAQRQQALVQACQRSGLGTEIAPGIVVVEYEYRLNEAREAMITPEERDEQGNLVREETYTPPQEERVEHVFTLRIGGLHIQKLSLTAEEFNRPTWKKLLKNKVSAMEMWTE
jgi:hypothetical protein